MSRRLLGLMIAVVAIAAHAGAFAAPIPRATEARSSLPVTVEQYITSMERVLRGSGHTPIESLFALGQEAADSLMLSPGHDGGPNALEGLDDSTFARLQRRMPGFVIWRDETTAVKPEPLFFLRLARSRGTAADTAFFHAYVDTYPDSTPGWPAYMEQMTDYGGCTVFGGGELIKAYDCWAGFIVRHPGRYVGPARDELSSVENHLTRWTWVCGDSASMVRELSDFVRRFPSATIAPRVRERIRAVRAGASGIRFTR